MTHDELPGDDWGGDTSPRPAMREREREAQLLLGDRATRKHAKDS